MRGSSGRQCFAVERNTFFVGYDRQAGRPVVEQADFEHGFSSLVTPRADRPKLVAPFARTLVRSLLPIRAVAEAGRKWAVVCFDFASQVEGWDYPGSSDTLI
jgi:hypothetical protein